MRVVNLAILIHGIVLDNTQTEHNSEYERLWSRLTESQQCLKEIFSKDNILNIEWGHAANFIDDISDDWKLTPAELFLFDRLKFADVRKDLSTNNHPLSKTTDLAPSILIRPMIQVFKEQMMVLGFADAIYYASADGEQAVRGKVYRQLLNALENFKNEKEIRVHVVSHSLGTSIAFDFLYSLFAPVDMRSKKTPDFLLDTLSDSISVERMRYWLQPENHIKLRLGSFSSSGSQIPIMLLRSQNIVDLFSERELLNPAVIGVKKSDSMKWFNFYDADDPLGFSVRRIFEDTPAVQEYEVNCGWHPLSAHCRYWQNDTVITETARLIASNLW